MDKKEKLPTYDGIVVFDEPVKIKNADDDTISIWGLLYDRSLKHGDDLWTWELNRYICYLMGCQTVQEKNGDLAPELWITSNNHIIRLGATIKNFIHRLLQNRMIGYKVVEYDRPPEIGEEEHEDLFITSKEPLLRLKLVDDKDGTEGNNKKDMRTKLTEMISTMDQYNGLGTYVDQYKVGERVKFRTAPLSEGLKTRLCGMLGINEEKGNCITDTLNEDAHETRTPDRLILHFEEFVNERCVRRPDSENRNYISQLQDKGEEVEAEEEE